VKSLRDASHLKKLKKLEQKDALGGFVSDRQGQSC